MPRWVMSTEVEPPERTSRSGSWAATASRSLLFFAPVGSHAVLATRGAPLAECREGDLRTAILEDVAPGLGLPEPEASRFAFDGVQGAGLLVLGQRVGVDRDDAIVLEPVVLRAAGGQQVDVRERLGGGIRQSVDDLCAELLELPAGDDRHLDALGECDQEIADAGIDRGLGGRERVVEVERDEAGDSVGHSSPVWDTRKAPSVDGASLRSG